MIVISDTSVVTNLTAVQQLELLPQLYDRVILPEAVYRELADIDPPVPGTLEVQTATWLEVRQVVNREVVERLQNEVKDDGTYNIVGLHSGSATYSNGSLINRGVQVSHWSRQAREML